MACTKLLLLSFTIICLTQFIKTDYIAAVVEYQPINSTAPNETVESNLVQYVYNIEQAQNNKAQIIVFPEYGLTGLVSDPNGYAIEIPNPGENTTLKHYWLQKLSNAALAHSMYVVINLLEQEKDKRNNTIYYNTNIVFDKLGKIVAKYRKINVYEEPAITPGSYNQNQNTFVTDFGITFGTFTCYDITFYNPAKSILTNTSVTDIVYPTAWYSFLPFHHSLSIQSGYALANKVNLLAANLNNIKEGMGGSGIYDGDGNIYSLYISGKEGTKLTIATVKNGPSRVNSTFNTFGFEILDEEIPTLVNFNGKRYFESQNYEFRTLNLSQKIIKDEVCHKYFCCVFTVNVSSANPSDIYKIMAFKGQIRAGEITDVKLCSLLACESNDINTCGERNVKSTAQFESITVETRMSVGPEQYFIPFSLNGDLTPMPNTVFNNSINDRTRTIKYYTSNIKQQNIIAFGIVGNSGVTLSFNYILVGAILILNYLYH